MALNSDGTLHNQTCTAPTTCRYCDAQVLWKEHEGQPQCFELDGQTLHSDVCAHRDECLHCGQKVAWVRIDAKWIALDRASRELHWSMCPRNPEAAKVLIKRLDAFERENAELRARLVTEGDARYRRLQALEGENAELKARLVTLEGDARYHRVELARLTKAAGLNGPKGGKPQK